MSKFTETWDATYEALPLNSEQESQGADRIRSLKTAVHQRLGQDHSWNGDDNDGYHNGVTLLPQAGDPSPTPANAGNWGALYTKGVNGIIELFYKNIEGTVIQLTSNGAINLNVASSGDVKATAASVAPAGWVFANGQSLDKTQAANAALFAAIGYTYGGSGNNFSVPDLRGRTIFGLDPGNATGRMSNPTLNGGGINAATLGATGGTQSHVLDTNELTTHSHGVIETPHSHNFLQFDAAAAGSYRQDGTTGSNFTTGTSADSTGISLAATGGTAPFNITPPGIILNWLIKL